MKVYLSEQLIIDSSTRKNLELVETLREKNKYGSLLWAIDRTKTNMGARLLKNWICQPLKRVDDIIARQNSVSELVQKSDVRYSLAESLEKIYDIYSENPKKFYGIAPDFVPIPTSFCL